MTLASLSRALFPTLESEEPRFRAEIERLAVIGARAIAGVCVGAPLFIYTLGFFYFPSLPMASIVVTDLIGLLVGAAALAISFWPGIRPYARALGIALGVSTALVQTLGLVGSADFQREVLQTSPEAQFPTVFALVLLIGVAVLPVRPIHTFGLGAFMLALFASVIAWQRGLSGFEGWAVLPLVFSTVMLAIAIGLTAVMYRVRSDGFLARLRAEESFVELQKAQASLLVERTAASQSRFAAALSHELNTPLGSLSSAFETLARLVEGLEADPRKRRAIEEAVRSGRISYGRLNTIAQRMRHLTNLDRAEERLVDLNALCSDTLEFLGTELGEVRVALDLAPLPPVRCRPQQIGAVLSNLVRNAAASLHGNAEGRIDVESTARNGTAVVEVRDNGRGIEPERLATLFEPAFRVDGGRVATTNWGLFVSRSIVSEHGGRLEIESAPGRGTTARVSLPVSR